jgi:hypothetical protein
MPARSASAGTQEGKVNWTGQQGADTESSGRAGHQVRGQPLQTVRLMRRTARPCRPVKVLLGVYVLGGLRGSQETRVRTHLVGCARCRAEYEELAEVPALLDMLTAEELDMLTAEEAAGAGRLPGQAGVSGESAEEPATQAAAPADGAKLARLLPLRGRSGG